jgi:diguanylate cyclase (GGDEF)-like protein
MIEKTLPELALFDPLPTAPGVGVELLQLLHRERSSPAQWVDVISADPALTSSFLRRARSAHPTRSGEVVSVRQAIDALGETASRAVIEDLSVAPRERRDPCSGFDYERYWLSSLARALAARKIAEHTGVGTPDAAYTLGLLAGIGRLALATLHPEEYARVLRGFDEDDPFRLTLTEREHFHTDHAELTACLLDDWGLPSSFATAAHAFERRERATDAEDADAVRWARLLRVAQALAETCRAPGAASEPLKLDALLEPSCRALGLDLARVPALRQEIESEWRARAALVRLLAPAAADGSPASVSAAQPRAPSGLRILAAGRDPAALHQVEQLLAEQGHKVWRVDDGAQALQAALEIEPQVVIADWDMPKLDGVEMCAALRRIRSSARIHFLLLIGRGEEARIGRAFEAGIDDYLIKPLDPQVLLARIQRGQSVLELEERAHSDFQAIRGLETRVGVLARKLEAARAIDPLTGFPNRREIFERLEDQWAIVRSADKPLSIILIDVDRFDSINQEHGYRAGDQALVHIAATLRDTTRLGEDLARFDGGEFIVVCPNSTAAQAAVGAERMRTAVELQLIRAGSFYGNFTVSIGVVERTAVHRGVDDLVRGAVRFLRAAKRGGGNQVCSAEPDARASLSA